MYPGDEERTRQLFAAQPPALPPPLPPPTAPPGTGRRGGVPRVAGLAVVVAALLAACAWGLLPLLAPPVPEGAHAFSRTDLPAVPADAQDTRVLPQVTTLLTGEHAFLAQHPDGTPVAPDPCRPFHYAINPAGMPEGAEVLVREAIAFISEYTGLAFVEDPFTDEAIDELRAPVQLDRYGDRWAPLLVAMADEATLARLGGQTAAVAQPHVVATAGAGTERVVTGQIALDSAFTDEAVNAPTGQAVLRLVLMHELGHIVGLGHVADPTQIMHESGGGYHYLGNGDRQGLAAVGAGRCFTDS